MSTDSFERRNVAQRAYEKALNALEAALVRERAVLRVADVDRQPWLEVQRAHRELKVAGERRLQSQCDVRDTLYSYLNRLDDVGEAERP